VKGAAPFGEAVVEGMGGRFDVACGALGGRARGKPGKITGECLRMTAVGNDDEWLATHHHLKPRIRRMHQKKKRKLRSIKGSRIIKGWEDPRCKSAVFPRGGPDPVKGGKGRDTVLKGSEETQQDNNGRRGKKMDERKHS